MKKSHGPSHSPDTLRRRTSDRSTENPAAPAADDPDALYQALRGGQRSIDEIAHVAPLDVIFTWHAQRKISEAEFSALLAAQEIQEVEIGDITATRGDPDAQNKRTETLIAALTARLDTLEQVTSVNTIGDDDLKAVFQATQPLFDGIGIRLQFAAGATAEGGPAAAGKGTLTLLCRAYIASTSVRSAVKCEAAFISDVLPHRHYCRLVLPLPLMKGGRRRLHVSVLDHDTRQPVELPPAVAELFHEKYLVQLQLMKKPMSAAGALGGLVKGTIGRMFGR